jgi:hypothetical protein
MTKSSSLSLFLPLFLCFIPFFLDSALHDHRYDYSLSVALLRWIDWIDLRISSCCPTLLTTPYHEYSLALNDVGLRMWMLASVYGEYS